MLYARVSQARNDTRSVPDQLADLRAWAQREGWQIVTEHSDEMSASRYANGKTRPGWQQTMDVIAAGGVDVLCVWEISRASRDRPVFAALIAACADTGVMIATGGRLHDPSDPDDGFMLDLGGALAVRESSMTSKRVRRAVESRAAAGKPHAGLPYGYQRVCSSETGKTLRWELHPDRAKIIEDVFKRLLARESADSIARDLNRRGIPTGGAGRCMTRCGCRGGVGKRPDPEWVGEHQKVTGRWVGGNMRKLALNPAYAALRGHHGRVLDDVKADWPRIISEADHHRLVALYGDPGRDKFRNPKHLKYLGGGLFRCGREGCGAPMRVVVHAGKPNRYDCRECHRVSRLQAPVDEFVQAVLVAWLSKPNVLAVLSKTDDSGILAARDEVTRLQAKLAEARRLVDEDLLSLESLVDLEARMLPRIRVAQVAARPRNVPEVVADIAGEQAASRWEATPITGRRAALDALMVVTILPMARRFQAFDPESVRIDWRT